MRLTRQDVESLAFLRAVKMEDLEDKKIHPLCIRGKIKPYAWLEWWADKQIRKLEKSG